MVDNQPAIALAKNPVLHDRTNHIDTRFHFIHDCDRGQIVLEFMELRSEDQDWSGGNQGRAARLGEELLNNLLLVLHRSQDCSLVTRNLKLHIELHAPTS